MSTAAQQSRLFPSLEQVRELPAQLSMASPPKWEDRNGHVNVQFYLTLYERGGWTVLEDVGFDDAWFRRQEVGMFDLEHHLCYLALRKAISLLCEKHSQLEWPAPVCGALNLQASGKQP